MAGEAFSEGLQLILEAYLGADSSEPLDGDEVSRLTEHLRNALNLSQGNITEAEFYELEEMAPAKALFHDKSWGQILEAARNNVDQVDDDPYFVEIEDMVFHAAEATRNIINAGSSYPVLLRRDQ